MLCLCILIVIFVYFYYVCSVLCILFHCVVLFTVCVYMCNVLLPPGVNPLAVKKYIISYHIISYHIIYRQTDITKLSGDFHGYTNLPNNRNVPNVSAFN
jgi:hypothetical protein